jgi:hypothetical protein
MSFKCNKNIVLSRNNFKGYNITMVIFFFVSNKYNYNNDSVNKKCYKIEVLIRSIMDSQMEFPNFLRQNNLK